MELKDIKLGTEGDVKLTLEGGKLILMLTHIHASGSVSIMVSEDAKYFLEKLKVAIPGSFDDVLINLAEASLP